MIKIELPNFFNMVNKSTIIENENVVLEPLQYDKYDFIKNGEYFWAELNSSDDICVFVKEYGNYFIAGNWEGSFDSNSFRFIEKINKPNK